MKNKKNIYRGKKIEEKNGERRSNNAFEYRSITRATNRTVLKSQFYRYVCRKIYDIGTLLTTGGYASFVPSSSFS